MAAIAILVGLERRHQIGLILTGNFGNAIQDREGRFVLWNAMAANAHGVLASAGGGIALEASCWRLRHDGLGVWSVEMDDGEALRIGRTYLPKVKAMAAA